MEKRDIFQIYEEIKSYRFGTTWELINYDIILFVGG